MLLIDPRAQERDNANAMRKYPFADYATCGNGKVVIVPGAIIDAQLYIPTGAPSRVWLSSISSEGKLIFSDETGVIAETTTEIIASSAVPITYTGDGGPCHGGVVVFGEEQDVSVLRAMSGQTFTADETPLAPAAITWLNIKGVTGFKLDDGSVVTGKVKFRGANGCEVETFTAEDGTKRFRISAIGLATDEMVSGFITTVTISSTTSNLVASRSDISSHVVNVVATGSALRGSDGKPVGQDELCEHIKKKIGTTLSDAATSSGCTICPEDTDNKRKPTLSNKTSTKATPEPAVSAAALFTVTFKNYGTLHLCAPNTDDGYNNPLTISGVEFPIPKVRNTAASDLATVGPDGLAELVLSPAVATGEVTIGIRGLNKATML